MFLGTYRTKFSGLGRVILPKRLRENLKEVDGVILTRGLDGCIWGFDKKDWEEESKKQLEIPVTEVRGRALRRYIFSGAELAELDLQGRFIISSTLLSYAKVKDEVVIIGAGDHFEVWNPNSWDKILAVVEG